MSKSPFLALLMANARLTAALGQWVISRNPDEATASELAAAADEQLAALTRLRAELDHPPAAR